jgi:protein SCO1
MKRTQTIITQRTAPGTVIRTAIFPKRPFFRRRIRTNRASFAGSADFPSLALQVSLVPTLRVGTHVPTLRVAEARGHKSEVRSQESEVAPRDLPLTTHDSPLTPSSRLAVIQPAPDFTLITQDGSKLASSELKGNVLLVSFIFTTCNCTCPATTHRMSQIQEEIKSRSLFKDGRVRLLSISLDPARDTPEVLRGYMRLYDADPAHWTFLTGSPDQVSGVVKSWGMWAKPAANGQLDHPSRIFLVDAQYRIREIYNLNFLKPKWVVQDVELLLKEASSQKH